jgi:dTDP-4-amino-4,6-dideoxygalactose transaminase
MDATTMILMNDFKAEPEDLIRAQAAAAERVIRSGWYVLGAEVKSFEAAWAARCGAAHCIGVGNGMDAIEIGLRALGIGPGDEVVTTPMTAFATVLAVLRAGAVPVLADIDPSTGLLDPESAERCLTPKSRAVLLVHLYGQIRNMDRWTDLCRIAGLSLLEDCAQSHLAAWKGRAAGRFGEFGAYSFYPTKNLGTLGDGGAILTDREDLAEMCGKLRNYGQSRRYHHPHIGLNSRLDELHAALLTARLDWLDAFTARRRAVAAAYQDGIRNEKVRLMAAPLEAENHVHHLFPILCFDRDGLMEHLKAKGVEAQIHYPVPIHHQEPCRNIARDPAGLPRAEAHAREVLSIPCHPQLGDAEVERVIEAVNSF